MFNTARNIILVVSLGLVLVCFVAVAALFLWARQDGLNPVKAVQLRINLAIHDDDLNSPIDPNDREYYPFRVNAEDTAPQIAANLEELGLINDADLFEDYVQYHQLDTRLLAELYYLQKSNTIPEIARIMAGDDDNRIQFTVTPGMRLEEIKDAIDAEPDFQFTGTEFLDLAGRGKALPPSLDAARLGIPQTLWDGGPAPSLEGFILPGSYTFWPDITVVEFRDELLRAFSDNMTDEMITLANQRDLSIYQVLTVASIVEREVVDPNEYPMVAAVYLNRLEDRQILEADPTVQYAIGWRNGEWWTRTFYDEDFDLKPETDQRDIYYNTYLTDQVRQLPASPQISDILPPGPIGSPSLSAINGVLRPADTTAKYMVSCDGYTHLWAAEYEDHVANYESCNPPLE
ncbi:MAG: endolytic transglycosylase MltG [Chloroflexi bacterium]|nr:endolytic transglycosylase MltG [Chloroflexota bacterium]